MAVDFTEIYWIQGTILHSINEHIIQYIYSFDGCLGGAGGEPNAFIKPVLALNELILKDCIDSLPAC